MMKYQQNPVDAIQWNGNTPSIEIFMSGEIKSLERITNGNSVVIGLKIQTANDNELLVTMGDWIIKEPNSQFKLMPHKVFKINYLPVIK